MKKDPLEIKKEQNHCTKATYTGINWGVNETEYMYLSYSFGIETMQFIQGGILYWTPKLTILWY